MFQKEVLTSYTLVPACLGRVGAGELPQPGGLLAGASASQQARSWTEGSVSCQAQKHPLRIPTRPLKYIPKAPGQGLWLTIALNSQQILLLFFLKASGRDRVTALGKGLENVV